MLAQSPWLVWAAGGVALIIALVVMSRLRWAQSRPLVQCVVLSLVAHVILVVCACFTNWSFTAPKGPRIARIRVRLADDRIDRELATEQLESDNNSEATLPETQDRRLEVEPRESVENVADSESAKELAPDDTPASETSSVAEVPTVEVPVPIDTSLPPPETLAQSTRSESSSTENLETPDQSSRDPSAAEDPLDTDAAVDPSAESAAADSDEETLWNATDTSDVQPIDTSATDVSHLPETNEHGRATHRIAQIRTELGQFPADGPRVPPAYQGRGREERMELSAARGGSLATEEAVEQGLGWLARAQDEVDGHWDTSLWEGGHETRDFQDAEPRIDANSALTGLAILAFLGAGYTHREGPYAATVEHGLAFLIAHQLDNGCLGGSSGRYVSMYSHGIATLAISEAYILTGDQRLKPVLQRAIAYTVSMQHRTTGGWRYQAGDIGDTSQFGWQVMALVSARSAGIDIPPAVWTATDEWLQRVALGTRGGLACYTPSQRIPSASMTAEAAVCRFFLHGPETSEVWDEAADWMIRRSPRWRESVDVYYAYYATMAFFLSQDPRWPSWNRELTNRLLPRQRQSGRLAGSWDPTMRWGESGGRVYTTAMSCLCLETYYRYLPVYRVARAPSNSTRARRYDPGRAR